MTNEDFKKAAAVFQLHPEIIETIEGLPSFLKMAALALDTYSQNLGGQNVIAPKLRYYEQRLLLILDKINNVKNS